MEPAINNGLVIKQMESYNFDAPIKVAVLFEDYEADNDISATVDNNGQNDTNIPNMVTDLLQRRFTSETPLTSNVCYPNINFDNIENAHVTNNQVVVPVEKCMANTESSFRSSIKRNIQNLPLEIDQTVINSSRKQLNHLAHKIRKTDTSQILHSLDQVSFNLIEISKCYYDNFTINLNNDSHSERQAEIHYNNFKEHYFRLSYNIVVKIFLPQENNQIFIRSFVNRTLDLAYNKPVYVDRVHLRSLITSLIAWTKEEVTKSPNEARRQFQIRSLSNRRNHQIPKTINRLTNSHTTNLQSTNRNSDICLFSAGPQNQEIKISIQPEELQRTIPFKNMFSNSEKNPQTYHLNRGSNNFDINSQFHNNEKELEIQRETCIPNTSARIPVMDNMDSRTNHAVGIHLSPSENELQTRSSVSRDSGFASPVTNIHTKDHNICIFNTETSADVPPIQIMSTENSNTPIGYCITCHSPTSQMCTGCFQAYYCSIKCQVNDYVIHEFFCRKPQS